MIEGGHGQIKYHRAGNFRGIQVLRKSSMQRFHDVIFVDGRSG